MPRDDESSLAGVSYCPSTQVQRNGEFTVHSDDDIGDTDPCIVCTRGMLVIEKKWQGKPVHKDYCLPAVRACRRVHQDDEEALTEFDNLLFEDPDAWRETVAKFVDPSARSDARQKTIINLYKKKFHRTEKFRHNIEDDATFNADEFVTMKQAENKFLKEAAFREEFRTIHAEQGGLYDEHGEQRIHASYKSRGRSAVGVRDVTEVTKESLAAIDEYTQLRGKVRNRLEGVAEMKPANQKYVPDQRARSSTMLRPVVEDDVRPAPGLTVSALKTHTLQQQESEDESRGRQLAPQSGMKRKSSPSPNSASGVSVQVPAKKTRYDPMKALADQAAVLNEIDIKIPGMLQVDYLKVLKGFRAVVKMEKLVIEPPRGIVEDNCAQTTVAQIH